jgi:hypothetical protein
MITSGLLVTTSLVKANAEASMPIPVIRKFTARPSRKESDCMVGDISISVAAQRSIRIAQNSGFVL